jgi:hypothetical protein
MTLLENLINFTLLIKSKQWLQAHLGDTILGLALACVGLATGLWASVIILDDALITFRVAENLAHGHGFVYNIGERVQVTTTPLYAMVLAVGVWLFGSAPRAALVLNISLAALIPMLTYDLGRRLSGRLTGIGGALLLTLAPLLISAFSMESYLYVTLVLASMEAYLTRRYRLAGILVGTTALVRGDAVLLGACLLTYDFLAQRGLRWRLIVPAIAVPLAWYLFAIFYYGSPFPATLGAKVAQGEFNWLGQRFLDGLLSYWDSWTRVQDYDTFYLIPILMVVGLIPVIRVERAWLIIIGYDILYVTTFVVLAVPAADWYYAPLMPGMALLTARGIQFVAEGIVQFPKSVHLIKRLRLDQRSEIRANPPRGADPLRARTEGPEPRGSGQAFQPSNLPAFQYPKGTLSSNLPTFFSTSIAGILLLILLTTIYPITKTIIQQNPNWKAQVYPDTARWIAENTNPSANLATIDIGHLGYWSGRPIIDIVGLVQPDVAPQIAQGDFGYAIRRYQPDMVLIGYSWLPEVQRTAWFQTNYVPRHYFKFKTLDEPLLLFSRREGVKVQPDPIPAAAIQPLSVDFNRQISLTGYHLPQPLFPGSPLSLTLFWQVEAPIAVDFTVFVQMVEANNHIIAQKDNKPQNGFYGTTYWQPGEQIVDRHTLLIPPDIPPGHYDILLGFYETKTGLRLQILDEAGTFKIDHLRLSDIEVRLP